MHVKLINGVLVLCSGRKHGVRACPSIHDVLRETGPTDVWQMFDIRCQVFPTLRQLLSPYRDNGILRNRHAGWTCPLACLCCLLWKCINLWWSSQLHFVKQPLHSALLVYYWKRDVCAVVELAKLATVDLRPRLFRFPAQCSGTPLPLTPPSLWTPEPWTPCARSGKQIVWFDPRWFVCFPCTYMSTFYRVHWLDSLRVHDYCVNMRTVLKTTNIYSRSDWANCCVIIVTAGLPSVCVHSCVHSPF